MSQKRKMVIALVVIWIILVVTSYIMSSRIEGPRNIDTGFRRLDVLVRYQVVALVVAVVSAVAGVLWRQDGNRIMLIGLAPLILTILLVVAIVAVTMILNPRLTPEEAYQPPKISTPTTVVPVEN